jgi:hypothetical protein
LIPAAALTDPKLVTKESQRRVTPREKKKKEEKESQEIRKQEVKVPAKLIGLVCMYKRQEMN